MRNHADKVKREDMIQKDYLPTMSGTYIAYEPEWRYIVNDEWQIVPSVIDNNPTGIPFPRLCGGINQTIGLMGMAQAQAVAWGFAAHAESEGRTIEVRIHPYEVIYDIKARKLSEEEIEKKINDSVSPPTP